MRPIAQRPRSRTALARRRHRPPGGRVEFFNATCPGRPRRLDQDLRQYELMHAYIVAVIDDHAGGDGSVALREIADAAHYRYAMHPAALPGRNAAGLDDEQWARPSLCTQWRSKDRSASG